MPLSEVPPQIPAPEQEEQGPEQGSQPEARANAQQPGDKAPRFGKLRDTGRSGNLDGLEHHELITLVEDLEDDRARARVREGIWISIIVHLLVFWLYAYAPQVLFHRPRVVNPADIMAKRPQDYQFLDLPPDALKHLTPPHTKILSDKDRVAQSPHPTLDKKTLAQLEAMKPAGPPAPARPSEPQQNPAPQQQQAQNQPQNQPQQKPPPSPQANQQIASNNLPSAPQPDLKSLMGGSARSQINRAEHGAAGSSGGNYGSGAPSNHQGINSGMDILSDTLGVDFGPYMARLKFLIERAWYPLIPEAARPPLMKQGVVAIRFVILPDGTLQVGGMHLDGRSGDVSLDRAAWGGVTGATPFPPLPKEYLAKGGKVLEIRGAFLYNLTPDQLGQQR